jgi:hypothetical protein
MYTLCVEAPGWESCAGKQPGRHTKARLPAPNASSAAEQKTPVAEPLRPVLYKTWFRKNGVKNSQK